MATLGLLDKRTVRKRCVACAKRKIKCQGPPPCVYCTKRNQACFPQDLEKRGAKFVNLSAPLKTISAVLVTQSALVSVPRSPSIPQDELVKHFFSGFLATNNFGGNLDLNTIISSFQSSRSLYNIVLALGASDMSRLHPGAVSSQQTKASVSTALTAYRTSVVVFQKEIENKNVLESASSLWTTFFLGLFELMYDVTGNGWVKHILYGTYRILQLRGPDAHLTGSGRSFFLTLRVFEICRSLIYSEPTFLAEKSWMGLTECICSETKQVDWHPKEALFDLMIACSSLSHRVREVVEPDSNCSAQRKFNVLINSTIEGHRIRTELAAWYISAQGWRARSCPEGIDSRDTLAEIYFHAISIYLSGIFDYRTEFLNIDAPTLSQNTIQAHVNTILLRTSAALKTTNLAGVLLFFPLRVCGARVTTVREGKAIEEMLKQISGMGFVVADAFVSELQDLWTHNGIYDPQRVDSSDAQIE